MKSTKTILKVTPVAPGKWGASGIILSIESKTARIEYDCAEGEITEAISTNSQGNFKLQGTHTRHSFGPIRLDNLPKSLPAIYEGNVSGDRMTLKVTLTGDGSTVGEYTLERGKSVRLHRCY